MKKLSGVITAMTTPFDAAGRIDTAALEAQTDFLILKKVDCLYPCGTTGEMYLMSAAERELVAETVVKRAAGRVTVYVHTGAMTTEETVRLSLHARNIGADGIGVVTPSYFRMSDAAMLQYYRDVARSLPSDFPLYTYNIPQLSGNDISPEILEQLSEEPNIVGIKYSFADMTRLQEYRKIKNGGLSVVFGPDHLFLPALVMGCDGTVSGCSGPVPEVFVDLYSKYRAGDLEGAAAAQRKAAEAVKLLKAGSDLSIFKAVLSARGIPGGSVRKPLLGIDGSEKRRILDAIGAYYGG